MFRNSRTRIIAAFMLTTALSSVRASIAMAGALPTGGAFVAGSGQIATSGSAMTINQTSARGVIDWRGFSIGSGNSVQFNNGAGATMNRVTGAQMSQIDGKLGAAGSVFLINPNGVVVGPGGQVVTNGSFVASTRDISNGQFIAGGSMTASGQSSGAVVNRGTIRAANGNVVLIGQSVTNEGVIVTGHRTAAMIAADSVVLSETGGPSGIYVAAGSTGRGDVTNAGRIQAAAVELASAHGNVYALGGNHQGAIQATGAQEVNGEVYLTAGDGTVDVGGRITAHNTDGSGGQIVANGRDVALASRAVMDTGSTVAGRAGGTILVGTSGHGQNLAQTVKLADGARLTAGGKGAGLIETSANSVSTGALTVDAGRGGTWLTDPDDLTIDSTAAGTIQTALNAGTNVTEQTTASGTSGAGTVSAGSGDINVNSGISWSGKATLTLDAYRNLNVNAPITVNDAGAVVIQTNGDDIFNPGGSLTYSTQNAGSLSVNGAAYTLLWGLSGLNSIGTAGSISGNFALAGNVDDASALFTPIAHTGNFVGVFDGLGHSVSNLNVNDPTHAASGLFGISSGTIANVSVSGIIDGRGGPTTSYVGGVVGQNNGLVRDSHSSATVYGYYVGGLSGGSATGTATIERSTSSGNVYALDGSPYSGGLAGTAASVIDSSASGNVVSSVAGSWVGGLVGYMTGDVSGSSASGNVTASGSGVKSGGLVGFTTGGISDSIATGTVTAGQNAIAGGLVGQASGTLSSVRASGNVTGGDSATVGGLAGRNYGQVTQAIAIGDATTGVGGSAGGLVGQNEGGISVSYATGNTTASGATGTLGYAGGLVGDNEAAISQAYSTGSATGLTNTYTGGLIGKWGAGTVSDTYATGLVTGQTSQIGGFAGLRVGNPGVSHGYWDTVTTGTQTAIGKIDQYTYVININGLTTGQFARGQETLVGGWVTGAPYEVLSGLPYIVVTGAGYAHETYGSATVTAPKTVTATASDGIDTTAALAGIGPWHGYSQSAAGNAYATWAEGVTAPWHQTVYHATVMIDPAALTIKAGDATSTYGQTPDVSGAGYTVSGLLNSDSVSGLNLSTIATKSSNTGTYDITASGATGTGISNYIVVYQPGTLTIDPAALTVIANDKTSTYGQTPALGTTGFTANGLVNGDTISGVNLTTTATGASSVGQYGITASGAVGYGLGNYAISYQPGTLTIDPATLTVTAGSGTSVYGEAVSTPGYKVSGLVNGDTVTAVSVDNTASSASAVGDYAVNASGAAGTGLGNYNVQYVAGDWSITPQTLTVKAGSGSVEYGQTAGGYGFTATGLANGDTVNDVTLSTPATAQSSVGQYALNASDAVGTGLGNYTIAYQPGTLTITPAPLTVTAGSGSSVYGTTPSAAGYSVAGLVNGDTVSGVSVNQPVTGASGVGSYVTTASAATGSGLGNYVIDYENGSWNVTPATLTIAANDASSVYGQAPKTAGFTASGLVNGDAVSSVDLSTTATAASSIGDYAINVSGATGTGLSNYTIGYQSSTLTIDPAALTVTALNQNSTYGQNPALGTTGFSASGLVNGDTISGVRLTTAATGASGVGQYGIVASNASGVGLGNYAINYQGGTLTVDPAALTVIAGNGTSVYGQPAELPGWTVNGLVNGDRVTSVTVDTGHTVASGVGTYTTTASGATGSGLGNYTIAYQNGSWTVTPATVVVKPDDQTSVYGQTPLSQNPGVIAVAAVTPAASGDATTENDKVTAEATVSCNSGGNLVGQTEMTCQTRGK
ncbi:filamentous hemagglutinin N-terminal domain-containing protein [Gluconacetobacter sp. 1b LMG 1731]|uniref:Filamentous hemagglutinin N-terminal domain-containing protein n=1 Tax=Gluconacetobacter dulcium TaxID=2729096 RepID=A0A7W4IKR2_9PROT|nr:MBG domain-containing protein [Gluconacetobacter dulcium]MBB2164665.1 filamentous hemagglutinin N-terminal domain-containing protein [Gluconacetobacter dulcium]MBB2193801.1 filamentous hemagglutinin N-terminal domain-containing protein [Gluconacetobacter dulcium]